MGSDIKPFLILTGCHHIAKVAQCQWDTRRKTLSSGSKTHGQKAMISEGKSRFGIETTVRLCEKQTAG
jgi:hypothetical protein